MTRSSANPTHRTNYCGLSLYRIYFCANGKHEIVSLDMDTTLKQIQRRYNVEGQCLWDSEASQLQGTRNGEMRAAPHSSFGFPHLSENSGSGVMFFLRVCITLFPGIQPE